MAKSSDFLLKLYWCQLQIVIDNIMSLVGGRPPLITTPKLTIHIGYLSAKCLGKSLADDSSSCLFPVETKDQGCWNPKFLSPFSPLGECKEAPMHTRWSANSAKIYPFCQLGLNVYGQNKSVVRFRQPIFVQFRQPIDTLLVTPLKNREESSYK